LSKEISGYDPIENQMMTNVRVYNANRQLAMGNG
jgi:hypothetical protein